MSTERCSHFSPASTCFLHWIFARSTDSQLQFAEKGEIEEHIYKLQHKLNAHGWGKSSWDSLSRVLNRKSCAKWKFGRWKSKRPPLCFPSLPFAALSIVLFCFLLSPAPFVAVNISALFVCLPFHPRFIYPDIYIYTSIYVRFWARHSTYICLDFCCCSCSFIFAVLSSVFISFVSPLTLSNVLNINSNIMQKIKT